MSPIVVVAGVLALALAVVLFFALRLGTRPGRTRHWSTPLDALGLAFEDVTFSARDGTRLVGWYIPPPETAPRPAPGHRFRARLAVVPHGHSSQPAPQRISPAACP